MPREVEAVKWQLWVGHQLCEWRKHVPAVKDPREKKQTPKGQKEVAALVGLTPDAMSRIESGHRRVDAVELRALASLYGKTTADIAALFTAPTPDQWQAILTRHTPDPRFTAPPTEQALLQELKRPDEP